MLNNSRKESHDEGRTAGLVLKLSHGLKKKRKARDKKKWKQTTKKTRLSSSLKQKNTTIWL